MFLMDSVLIIRIRKLIDKDIDQHANTYQNNLPKLATTTYNLNYYMIVVRIARMRAINANAKILTMQKVKK